MKILLIGDYSGVFSNLAEGFRCLGHQVTLISNGDLWKNYPRDIDLNGKSSVNILLKIIKNIPNLVGYDVVQIVNPAFIFSGEGSITINLFIFKFLKKHNGKIFLSAIGDDYFWVEACQNNKFRYSMFDLPYKDQYEYHFRMAYRWQTEKYKDLNTYIAKECDGIIAGLAEYFISYKFSPFRSKLHGIPFPIKVGKEDYCIKTTTSKLTFFLGIQKNRVIWKGMDIIEEALLKVEKKYPKKFKIVRAESIPFSQYDQLIKSSDIILDQLYSYSPAMNGLSAMAKGLILIGGGEPEMYDFVGESSNKPIINIIPNKNQIEASLEMLFEKRREDIHQIKEQSKIFVEKNHSFVKIAEKYIKYYLKVVEPY